MKSYVLKSLLIALILGLALSFASHFVETSHTKISGPGNGLCVGPTGNSAFTPVCSSPLASSNIYRSGFPLHFYTKDVVTTSNGCVGVCANVVSATATSKSFGLVKYIVNSLIWTLILFALISLIRALIKSRLT